MSKKLALSVTLSVLLLAPSVFAQQSQSEYWDGAYKEKSEHRSDVTLGAATGLVLGRSLAYPGEVSKLDNPDYEVNTGLGVGSNVSFWFGAALKDWFVFGVGGMLTNLKGSDATASGGAFLFHLEAYPFYRMGGGFRDLAIYGNFGAGGMGVQSDTRGNGSGGFGSLLSLGSAYEAFRFGHFAIGPNVAYSYFYSTSANSHLAELGVRVVFYGGPSQSKKTASLAESPPISYFPDRAR